MALYFDSHAHYDDEQFDADRGDLLASLISHGVGRVLNASSDVESSRRSVSLANRYDFIFASVGIHPHEASSLDDDSLLLIEQLSREPRAVAIGEIGLDYYYDHSPREVQRTAFERQLQLAYELDLPVIIHSRDAAQETFELVKQYRPRGVVHCFSGSAELAREYAALGMYLGFTGVVTFAKARRPLEAACAVALDRVLIETDCPYLAPVPHRGKRCDSTMLPLTARAIAEARGIDPALLVQATWDNASRVYEIE